MSPRRAFWVLILFVGGIAAWVATTSAPVVAPTPPPPKVEVAAAVEKPPEVAAAPVARGAPTEAELMFQLRSLVDGQPEAALTLAKDAELRFPNGAMSDERSWLQMKALVNLNRIADARVEATTFFEQHPQSPFGEQVFRLTGMHPRPRPPVP